MFSCSSGEAITSTSNSEELAEEDTSSDESQEDEIESIVPSMLIDQMGFGWNLGNSFDVISRDKTSWGNPLPTKAMIDLVANSGFKTLRIPVTWGFHQDENEPFTIESDYLQQVQDVVDYGMENDMFVIINVHHDDDWVQLFEEEKDYVLARLSSLWEQVAMHFKGYDEHLIFDILNEPRLKDTPLEWTGGNAQSRAILNEYHIASVAAIRNTGGNNTSRILMVSTYAASTLEGPMNDLEIPNNDPNIMVSIHTYFPFYFTLDENGASTWGTSDEKIALDTELERIYQKWVIEEGRTVILGEWGAINKNNLNARIEYASYYASAAKKKGFVPIVWDDGGNFRLQNRNNTSWQYPEIVEAILNSVD